MVMDRGGAATARGHRLDGRVVAGGRRVAAGEHARTGGHEGLTVDADLSVLDLHSGASFEEVLHERLADGEDDRVRGEREVRAVDRQGLAAARVVGLAELAAEEPEPGHVSLLPDDGDRLHEQLDLESLVAGLLQLGGVGRHLDLAAAVDEGHVRLTAGPDLKTDQGARGVEGHVAAADHHRLLAGVGRAVEVDLAQQSHGVTDALQLHARQLDGGAPLQPRGEVHGGVAVVPEQAVDGEVAADARLEAELDAQRQDLVDLPLQHVVREPVAGDAEAQHAARHALRLEHGDPVPEAGEVAGAGEAGGAGADDRHTFRVDPRRRPDLLRGSDGVGHEALERGDGDRFIDLAARAGALAEVGADAAADARERVGLGRHPVGFVEAAGGHERHVSLRRGAHGAGRPAGAGAAPVHGERARHRVGELAVDRRASRHAEVVLARHGDRADLGALAAAHARLGHVARLVAQPHAELAGRTRDLLHLREGVDVHPALQRRARESRRQGAHGAVLGGERLGEPRHVAAQRGLALHQMHVDAAPGELLGGGHAGDAAADHQRRAVQERPPSRQVAHVAGAGHGARHDLPRLLLGALGLITVYEAAALADVGEGDRVLPQPELAADALEGGSLEARGARGDDHVVEAALLHRLLDQGTALGAAHELADADRDHAVEGAGVAGQPLHVHDAADVAAAFAEEDPGPHGAPPAVAATRRAPMRSRKGPTSWLCVWTPTTLSGSAPSASASNCCTCRWMKGNSSPAAAEMMSL